MTNPYSAILFDLDGTIVDSAPGITSTLAYTFETLGLPVPSDADLRAFVGPPILDSFRDLTHLDRATSMRALAVYRERYTTHGVTDATIYPGVADVLKAISDAGIPLSLATSKPEGPARVILDHLNVLRYFTVVTGASEDESRSAKKDVVAEALHRLRAFDADLSNPIMVGDRFYDVDGAAANDVPTIYVDWGYGSPAEQEKAIAVVSDAARLAELLLAGR
jgi:phosphoglycolate phosphatase